MLTRSLLFKRVAEIGKGDSFRLSRVRVLSKQIGLIKKNGYVKIENE